MIAPPDPPSPDPASPSPCAHCGLPVGRAATRAATGGIERAFCCYGCYLVFRIRGAPGEEAQATWWLVSLGTGAFLSMNVMLASTFLYTRPFDPGEAWLRRPLQLGMAALAGAALAVLLPPIARAAFAMGRRGRLGTEALVLLASLVAWSVSVRSSLRGTGHVWFDTSCAVPLLFTLGRWIEAVARAREARRYEPLLASPGGKARVLEGGRRILREAASLPPGTQILVAAGERIPADGLLTKGASAIDESWLTGESVPRARGPGSRVLAGSRNGEGTLVVTVTASGEVTRRAQLARDVREALARRAPLLRATDRAVAVFVPGVVVLAAAALAAGAGMEAFLAVLTVACPCAIGLAAPLALMRGVAGAARRGIRMRDAAVLEALAGVRAVAFDKTGTLTRPVPRVVPGKPRGILALEHRLRPEVPRLIANLRRAGLAVHLLSGDRVAAVARAAREAGIESWRAGLSPEEKCAALASIERREGLTMMVGDGINDGPVLARAAVSVAVAEGAGVARVAADVVLAPSAPLAVDDLIRLARRVRATIRGNLAWAIGYNAVALAAAAAGTLRPLLAAVLMMLSGLTVVLHTQARLQRM